MTDAPQKPDEFITLWSIHARRVYAYILTLVANWADAEDIFQETSVTLWAKLDEFEPNSDFGAWACRIAYFKVLSHSQRRRSQEPFDEIFFESIQAESEKMSEELDARFLALQHCLTKLAARDRALIRSRYHQNRTPQQVAQNVGRSVPAVYKALRRIHDTLFECIQRQLQRKGQL